MIRRASKWLTKPLYSMFDIPFMTVIPNLIADDKMGAALICLLVWPCVSAMLETFSSKGTQP